MDSQGACEDSSVCGGILGLECDKAEICLIQSETCDEFARGRCVRRPDECSTDFKPCVAATT